MYRMTLFDKTQNLTFDLMGHELYTVVSRLCETRLGEISVFVKRDFGPAYNIAVHFVLDYVKFRLCETKNGLPSCSHNRETTEFGFLFS